MSDNPFAEHRPTGQRDLRDLPLTYSECRRVVELLCPRNVGVNTVRPCLRRSVLIARMANGPNALVNAKRLNDAIKAAERLQKAMTPIIRLAAEGDAAERAWLAHGLCVVRGDGDLEQAASDINSLYELSHEVGRIGSLKREGRGRRPDERKREMLSALVRLWRDYRGEGSDPRDGFNRSKNQGANRGPFFELARIVMGATRHSDEELMDYLDDNLPPSPAGSNRARE